MTVLVSKNGPDQQERTEAAAQRSVRLAMILSLSILGVAGAYFGALYLVAHRSCAGDFRAGLDSKSAGRRPTGRPTWAR